MAMKPRSGFLRSRLRSRLTETIVFRTKAGADRPAQQVRIVIERQDPTDPGVAADTPETFATIIGDSTLGVEVGDTFTYDGRFFRVNQPAVSSSEAGWKRVAMARERPS